jgi:hypothetical protein
MAHLRSRIKSQGYFKIRAGLSSCPLAFHAGSLVVRDAPASMIYLIGRHHGIGLHVIYVHYIWCECDFISDVGIFHLVCGEKIDGKFGNVQHIVEAFVGEFNPSFVGDLDWRVVPHQNRRTFT